MDGARGLRGHVAWNAARKRKLLEQPFQALFVLRDVRIDFAVGAFEVGVRDQSGPSMAGTGDIDHIEIVLLDDAVKMHIDEV